MKYAYTITNPVTNDEVSKTIFFAGLSLSFIGRS